MITCVLRLDFEDGLCKEEVAIGLNLYRTLIYVNVYFVFKLIN